MDSHHDVFISYNSEDRDTLTDLAKRLQTHGLSVWLDVWELRPGVIWQSALEGAIHSCRCAIVAVGGSGIGPWQNAETRSLLSLLIEAGRPIIPVLLPEAPLRIELPIFLRQTTWGDLRDGFTKSGFERLIWGITGERPVNQNRSVGTVSAGKEAARLEDVFCTAGLPNYTYVEPLIYQRVARDIRQIGKHVLISGPSGSGKTCLIFRIVNEMRMKKENDFTYISALDEAADTMVLTALSGAIREQHKNMVIVDDFHLLPRETRNTLGKWLKQLADESFVRKDVPTFVLIGISTSPEWLLLNSADLGPRLGIYRMPLAKDGDLSRLLRRGEEQLAIELPNRESIIRESTGSYYICQYLAQEICLENRVYETVDGLRHLTFDIHDVRNHLIDEVGARFTPYITAFVKISGTTNGQRLPFVSIVTLLASIPKALIPLDELLNWSREYRNGIELVKQRIHTAITTCVDEERLSKYVFYEEDYELFSI